MKKKLLTIALAFAVILALHTTIYADPGGLPVRPYPQDIISTSSQDCCDDISFEDYERGKIS